MQVRFKVNLGSRDAERLGLDFDNCLAGTTREVQDKAGEWLIVHGIAEQLESKLKPTVGAAQRPAIAEARSPEIQASSKPGTKAGNKNKES